MRVIKFRGKMDGQWRYATPDDVRPHDSIGYMLWSQFWHMVDLDTIGQYTGLKDKAGKEIYEGDITQTDFWDVRLRLGSIEWKQGGFIVRALRSAHYAVLSTWFASWEEQSKEIWIVGNIYDNPEMVEAQTK